jgi:hypothetical protein
MLRDHNKGEVPLASTSPAQDVEALVNALYATVRVPEFDDMLWPEVGRSLDLVAHRIRMDFLKYGRIPAEPLPPPPEALAAR